MKSSKKNVFHILVIYTNMISKREKTTKEKIFKFIFKYSISLPSFKYYGCILKMIYNEFV